MENCVFCKIVEGKEKAFKIYEDKKHIAILDLFPNIMGQTLVMPKDHINSYAFNLSDKELCELMKVTKKVAKMLEKGLKVKRVHMVIEGTMINHLHVKLYPAIGMKSENEKLIATEHIYFDEYKGAFIIALAIFWFRLLNTYTLMNIRAILQRFWDQRRMKKI